MIDVFTDPLVRQLLYLYSLQTEDEKNNEITKHKNKVGFNNIDGNILCSIVKNSILTNQRISQKQYQVVANRLLKYHKQIINMPPDFSVDKMFKCEIQDD